MDICDVYAQNIQPSQLKEVLTTDKHTEKGLAEERYFFLGWLKEQYKNGLKYSSQIDAWFWYKLNISFSILDEEEFVEINWMMDIEQAFDNQVRVANYNEFGGQQ